MKMLDKLLDQLGKRGLEVRYQSGDTLILVGPAEEKNPALLATLKAFKSELLERLRPRDQTLPRIDVHHPAPPDGNDGPETCVECKSHVWDAEETAMICEVQRCPMKKR